MSQFILIDHLKVQNANAIAGYTWGFPAITNFLGFVHNLSRKLAGEERYSDIGLSGCAVVAHDHKVHMYGPPYDRRFTQSRNPPYLYGTETAKKGKTPSVIEEGKMNMTVSLLIEYQGNIGNRADGFRQWLKRSCLLQRLAGGTIFDIVDINLYSPGNSHDVRFITRRLLPGFVLLDRSQYLEEHYQKTITENPEAELLDAWLDFSALKQKARPKSDFIAKHLQTKIEKEPENKQPMQLYEFWVRHLETPYQEGEIPEELKAYFEQLEKNKANKKLLQQWQKYCHPDEKTDAVWEYLKKPKSGYLIPIMTGYKAISQVYANAEVGNTRDSETDVCFVESVHSIGEWQSVHHIREPAQLKEILWHYQHEENWYLCQQGIGLIHDLTSQENGDNEKSEDFIYS